MVRELLGSAALWAAAIVTALTAGMAAEQLYAGSGTTPAPVRSVGVDQDDGTDASPGVARGDRRE
jgi:hypothetical protein